MFASSASTASTYVTGVVDTAVSGGSAGGTVVHVGVVSPNATTFVQNINGFTAVTSASTWNEWSFGRW